MGPTEEMRKSITEAMERGVTTAAIAAQWGVHPQTIYLWKRKGLLPKARKALTPQERFGIEVLVMWGFSHVKITGIFKRHRHTVERVVAKRRTKYRGIFLTGQLAEWAREKIRVEAGFARVFDIADS